MLTETTHQQIENMIIYFYILIIVEEMFKNTFNTGQPVFAKVRGYIPYPAKILEKNVNTKKEMYLVHFYGTGETAVVGCSMIWAVSSDNVRRFVSVKSLSRFKFKEGIEEMMAENIGVSEILHNYTEDFSTPKESTGN